MSNHAAGLSRHVYSGSAVAVGAVLTAPARYAQSWAPCCLPIIGGRSGSTATDVDWPSALDPVLHFDEAWTEVTGEQTGTGPNVYTTTIQIAVTNLNILNRITGNIDVTLTFTYRAVNPNNRNDDEVDVAVVSNLVPPNQPYAGLRIPGVTLPAITLNNTLYEQAGGRKFKTFRAVIGAQRPGNQHIDHPHGSAAGFGQGLFFTALAEPAASFEYATPNHGRAPKGNPNPDMAVHFAEWHAEPYTQNFTLLRVVLDNAQDAQNPQGSRFSGQIVIDENSNGRDP